MQNERMRWVWMFFLVGTLVNLRAQESKAEVAADGKSSLQTVIEPLRSADAEVEKLRKELKQAASDEAKQEIQKRIDSDNEQIRQLRGNFRDIIGGAEAAEYDGTSSKEVNLQEQIGELVQPLLGELRQATSSPRELDALRQSLANWKDRQRKADTVVARIDDLLKQSKDPKLVEELGAARRMWTGRQAESAGQIGVISAQITDRESNQKPMFETLSLLFSRFFRSRGMNLLLAILIAIAGFMITRRSYRWLRRFSPVHRVGKANLTGRISDILAVGLAVLVAFIGILLVFYLRGDWLLLTLAVVLIIGAAWAGKTALPPYIEQIRMMLNLGSVREGERVVHLGLPWKVQSIGFFTRFTNPELQGGTLRIPIRDLMAMTSREQDPKEPWFPTEPDDWAILSDGTYGKVITQTPEQVVFLRLGGSLKTFATADFLAESPEKLSHGFRISCRFGIDYKHQADATGTIPQKFVRALTTGLVSDYGRDAVRSVQVEFSTAGASSLDYEIIVDFDGAVASKYRALQRKIQSICLDTCNANDWVIPFTQITVHQAGE